MAIAIEQAEARRERGRRALRGAGPRLPRPPGVRARAGSQHARRLPHRPAPVRRLPGRAPPRRNGAERADVADFLADLATGNGHPAVLAGDDQPQGRLPALLLPAPAPRGADRRRPDGGARAAEQEPQAPPRPQLRRGEAAAGERRRRRRDRTARPRPARGDVRVRAAGLGGDRARRQRRGPAARLRAPARQGHQGAHRPARPRGGRGGQALPAGRSPGAGRRAPASRSCSSTSAAGR